MSECGKNSLGVSAKQCTLCAVSKTKLPLTGPSINAPQQPDDKSLLFIYLSFIKR
jgi:hypothetical protein